MKRPDSPKSGPTDDPISTPTPRTVPVRPRTIPVRLSCQQATAPQGLEPLSTTLALPTHPRPIRPGVRLYIRGRSVHLRGLRRAPTGVLRWVFMLGPGLIATSAGNDAGGIATYSAAGARYGYALIWVLLLLIVSLAGGPGVRGPLGAATGGGLREL